MRNNTSPVQTRICGDLLQFLSSYAKITNDAMVNSQSSAMVCSKRDSFRGTASCNSVRKSDITVAELSQVLQPSASTQRLRAAFSLHGMYDIE